MRSLCLSAQVSATLSDFKLYHYRDLQLFSDVVFFLSQWGRTGFDSSLEAQAACRGWFVGLVKNRTKTNKRRLRRSSSRGLIDRDVFAATPAGGENVDSRLAEARSDRARRQDRIRGRSGAGSVLVQRSAP